MGERDTLIIINTVCRDLKLVQNKRITHICSLFGTMLHQELLGTFGHLEMTQTKC